MTNTCANLDCDQDPTSRLRYQGSQGAHVYDLCDLHTDRAHEWLASRQHLAVTAVSERLLSPVAQPALF